MTINAQPDANIVATAIGVYAKIADVETRYPGMKFAVVFDQQRLHSRSDQRARTHGDPTARMLAVAVIFLFLHSWRSTIIVAVSLPVSVLGTLFAGVRARLFAQHHDARRFGTGRRPDCRRRDRRYRKHLPSHGARANAAGRRRNRDGRDLFGGPRIVGHRHHRVRAARPDSGACRVCCLRRSP